MGRKHKKNSHNVFGKNEVLNSFTRTKRGFSSLQEAKIGTSNRSWEKISEKKGCEQHLFSAPCALSGQNTSEKDQILPLEEVLLAVLSCVTSSFNQRQQMRQVVNDVAYTLSRLNLSVYVYGSWCTHLCIPSSDIDFIALPMDDCNNSNNNKGLPAPVRITNLRTSHKTHGHERQVLRQLFSSISNESMLSNRERRMIIARPLRAVASSLRHSHRFHSITAITGARVPIVKAVHYHGLKVDISFMKDGLVSSQFLCDEFKRPQYHLARGLIILIKALVANWRLDDPSVGGLGSFPIAMLVLWFLHSQVCTKYPVEQRDSYAVCLVGFLKFYGMCFDYKRHGIDYAQKCIFEKPPSSVLYVTNPLNPSMNCAASSTLFATDVVPRFREAFEIFADLLCTTADIAKVEQRVLSAFERSIDAVGGDVVLQAIRQKKRPTVDISQLYLGETNECFAPQF